MAVVIAFALAVTVVPQRARACGGLFCNSRPANPLCPLPVAQTGENIVFSIDKDPAGGATKLTAEIQISYAGDAAQFSWVVPVDAAPTLSVGTDQLFTALAGITQPTFIPNFATSGQCLPDPNGQIGINDKGTAPGFSGTGGATGAAGPASTVTVTFHGAVGPYDAAVIQSTDPLALKNWLSTNGYVVSDQAGTLIDTYVGEGKFFVALRLLNGDVKTIQPIVLDFIATEPCVPLRLTAIAANPDMQVRLWVFGDRRVVPRRFYEFKIDEARIDWLNSGSNYSSLVSRSRQRGAGRGRVRDGVCRAVASIAQGLLWSPGRYNLVPLQTAMTPPAYVQALISLGLASDPQTLPLLTKYIPMPAAVKAMGITDAQFYGNLSFYYAQYAFPPFDLATLTTQISAKIIEPRHTAQMMMDAHSYLTRLNTFISPEEMNDDPLFMTNGDLGNVSPGAHRDVSHDVRESAVHGLQRPRSFGTGRTAAWPG